MLRLLFLGDIIGEPGRKAVIEMVPKLRQTWGIDFVVVNGENAAAGRGITGRITIDLLRAGVAVITSGDHIWDQKELSSYIETEPRLLRPINYPVGTPGKGSIVLETAKGKSRSDQCAREDVYAAESGESLSANRRRGQSDASRNARDFCRCSCGNDQRENCTRAISGWESLGRGRYAHSRANRR